jgi:hypothetical protein
MLAWLLQATTSLAGSIQVAKTLVKLERTSVEIDNSLTSRVNRSCGLMSVINVIETDIFTARSRLY